MIGGNSQVFELRAGHLNGSTFVDHPGGSLVHARAINAAIQERVLDGNEVRALRASTSILGLGFVEAISDATLRGIANAQPSQSGGFIHGQGHRRSDRRGPRTRAHRALRLEGTAGEPALARGRRVRQPDRHHDAAVPDGEHLERQMRAAFDNDPAASTDRMTRADGDNGDLEAFARIHARDEGAAARHGAGGDGRRVLPGSNLFVN